MTWDNKEKTFSAESILVAFGEEAFDTLGTTKCGYVTAKNRNDLTPDQKKFFKSYMLSFCIYEPLDNFTKGLIFRNINKTTDVNHQEMLNSFGNIAIANVVRETVRLIENVKSDIHPFFETTDAGNFKWINYTCNSKSKFK